MYIPLSDDKHRKVQDSSKKLTENLNQIQSETKLVRDKIQSENFFLMVGKKFFFRLNFVSDRICFGLNFVSDYIPQLYFVCNLLIYLYRCNW